MRSSKPSPALVISIIALVFAMTGTGIAAKSLITGKQIKDGSITSKDLAKGAVTEKNLANGAVSGPKLRKQAVTSDKVAPNAIGAGALAPESVTTASLSSAVSKSLCYEDYTLQQLAAAQKNGAGLYCPSNYTVCPNGVIVSNPSPCPGWSQPIAPIMDATTGGGPITGAPGLPPGSGCYLEPALGGFTAKTGFGWAFPSAGSLNEYLDFWYLSGGSYRVTVDATWEDTKGATSVGITLNKKPLSGSSKQIAISRTAAAPTGQTTQNITLESADVQGSQHNSDGSSARNGDLLYVGAIACGGSAPPTLGQVHVRVVPRQAGT